MSNNIMPRINKVAGTKFHGFIMPKGAIYGIDEKGVYVCTRYTLYAEYMGKDGIFFKPVDCKIAGYKPTLRIFRPQRNFSAIMKGKDTMRHDNWTPNYECGETAQLIYALHKSKPHSTHIEKRTNPNNEIRYIKKPDTKELIMIKVPKVSNSEAKKVSVDLALPKYSQGFPIF